MIGQPLEQRSVRQLGDDSSVVPAIRLLAIPAELASCLLDNADFSGMLSLKPTLQGAGWASIAEGGAAVSAVPAQVSAPSPTEANASGAERPRYGNPANQSCGGTELALVTETGLEHRGDMIARGGVGDTTRESKC